MIAEKEQLLQKIQKISNKLSILKTEPTFIWRKREKKILGYKKSYFMKDNLLNVLRRLKKLNEDIVIADFVLFGHEHAIEEQENLEIEKLLHTLEDISGTYSTKGAYFKEEWPKSLLSEIQILINELKTEVEDLKRRRYELVHNKNPVIVWGEHRSTELLALRISELLATDSELKNKVKFVEFKYWRYSDYFSAYTYIINNYIRRNLRNKDLYNLWQEFMAIPYKKHYHEELVKNYGSLIFNFHDYGKPSEREKPIISFTIPSTFKEGVQLARLIKKLAQHFGLDVIFFPISEIWPIYVEFYPLRGTPYHLLTKDDLYKRILPESDWDKVQIPDVNHPLFNKSVEIFTLFMKQLLLEIIK